MKLEGCGGGGFCFRYASGSGGACYGVCNRGMVEGAGGAAGVSVGCWSVTGRENGMAALVVCSELGSGTGVFELGRLGRDICASLDVRRRFDAFNR